MKHELLKWNFWLEKYLLQGKSVWKMEKVFLDTTQK